MDPEHQSPQSIVNALPLGVVLITLAIVAVEFLFAAGESGIVGGPEAIGWRLEGIREVAFLDRQWAWMWSNGEFPPRDMARFVTYPFVHGSFIHALFAGVFVLALGKFVGEALGNIAVLSVFFVASIVGALAYGAVWDTNIALYGAYPGAYGLIGAFTAVLFSQLGQMGANQLQAFRLIGMLLALQLIFAVIFGGQLDWVADVAGAAAGFGLGLLFRPGAVAGVLAWMRQRR